MSLIAPYLMNNLTASGTTITATWVGNPFTNSYFLYQTSPATSPLTRWPVTGDSKIISGLQNGTTYTMGVTAVHPIDSAPQGGAVVWDSTAAYYGGKIYFYGGRLDWGTTFSNTLDIYDIGTNTWTTGTSGPEGRAGHSAAIYQGKMYIWGGRCTGAIALIPSETTMEVYDIAANSWTSITNWSAGSPSGGRMYTQSVAASNGGIYYWGGKLLAADGSSSLSGIIDIYFPQWNVWEQRAAGGTPRHCHTTVYSPQRNTIYFWGGATDVNGSTPTQNTIDAYNVATESWTTTLSTGGTAKICAIGGYDQTTDSLFFTHGHSASDSVDVFNLSNSQWTTKQSAPIRRTYAAGCLIGGAGNGTRIYIKGGATYLPPSYSPVTLSNTIDVCEIDSARNVIWLTGGTQRYLHTASAHNNKIYFIGGNNATNMANISTLDIFDINTNQWTTGLACPSALREHSAAVDTINSKIYVYGGITGSGSISNALYIYDIGANTWTTGTAGTSVGARYGHSSQFDSANGNLYVWGGYHASSGYVNTLYVYNTASTTWTQKTGGGTASRGHASCLYNGEMYFHGGTTGNTSYLNTLYKYNISGNNWETLTPSATPRAFHFMFVYNTGLACWGGEIAQNTETNDIDFYSTMASGWYDPSVAGLPSNGGTAKYGAGSVVSGARLLSWGGANGNIGGFPTTIQRTMDVLDFTYGTWSSSLESTLSDTRSAITIPSAPTGITVTNGTITTTQYGIQWNAVTGATSYKIFKNADTTPSQTSVSTNCIVSGLTPNTTTVLSVKAVNSTGDSAMSSGHNALTLPASPQNLAVSSITMDSLTLEWDNGIGDGALTYKISQTSPSNVSLENAYPTTTYPIASLLPSTIYSFEVTAHNASGDSTPAAITVTTTTEAPSNLIYNNITATTCDLFWDVTAGATSYNVFILPFETPINSEAILSNTYQISLDPNTAYAINVKAVNAGGSSSPSNTINILTLPEPPVDISAALDNTTPRQAVLQWSAPVYGAESYTVYHNESSTNTVARTLQINDLMPNSGYVFHIRSVNITGESEAANINVLTYPEAPIDVYPADTTADSITLAWTPPTGGAEFYNVYRDAEPAQTSYSASATIGGLAANSGYNVVVTAGNATGESVAGITSQLFGVKSAPNAPTNANQISIQTNNVIVQWNTPVNGADSYKIKVNGNEVATTIVEI